jgi:16S rRNA (cytosine967-C5)-methyltransferase
VGFTLPVGQPAAVGWQILPGDGDLDGMYYAVVHKRASVTPGG